MDQKKREYGVSAIIRVFDWQKMYCQDFNPRILYPKTDETERLITSERGHRTLVSKAYSLVTDMMDRKASQKEIQRAVRYLAVCIDAYEYQLDYRQAHDELGITELSSKYSFNGMIV